MKRIKKIREEAQEKKYELEKKSDLIKNQIDRINNIRSSHNEALINFMDRNDINGFMEYKDRLIGFKDTNSYMYPNNINFEFKPKINFYETDYITIDINEYDETIGEIFFNVEGFEKQLHFRLNGEAIDEVLINLQLEVDNLGEAKDRYFGFLLFKNNENSITTIGLDEKMVHNDILILGRTIVKSGLNTVVDKQKKCSFKLILSIFSV